MKIKLLKTGSTLQSDGKTLVFNDGICEVKKITKGIQFLIDSGCVEKIEEKENGKPINS